MSSACRAAKTPHASMRPPQKTGEKVNRYPTGTDEVDRFDEAPAKNGGKGRDSLFGNVHVFLLR